MARYALILAAFTGFVLSAVSGIVIVPFLHKLHFGQTIKEIGPYGKLVVDTTEDKEIKSKDHFLDVIGIGFYHESFKTSGQNATVVGDEVTEVIDTVFGKRTVSVRTMVNTTIPDNPVTFKIYYGINGVIYKIEYTTKDLASTVTLKSSNLLTTVA